MNVHRLRGSAVVLAGFVAACGTTEPQQQQQPAAISAVSGTGQTAEPGQALADPLIVQVRQDGAAVSGQAVSWVVTAGGGTVSAASSTTDNAGMAEVTWTLGPNEGANSVEASAAGLTGSPIAFAASAVLATPPPATAAVTVSDFAFTPPSSPLAVGGTVTWTWAGAVNHNVTFPAGASQGNQIAGTFSRTFPTAGSFQYQCTLHPGSMNGTIVVQ